MVKHYKKSSKSKKQLKTMSKSKKQTKRKSSFRAKYQRGGDDGRFVLPPSYFGKGTSGYSEDAFGKTTNSKQFAVSQGTIWQNGNMAGPNLYPMLGGDCGCKKRKTSKSKKTKKSKHNTKSRK